MSATLPKEPAKTAPQGASECGAVHGGCSGTWQGTCDREAGHDGSHHCNRCNMMF
jgi:hypothetical protein